MNKEILDLIESKKYSLVKEHLSKLDAADIAEILEEVTDVQNASILQNYFLSL